MKNSFISNDIVDMPQAHPISEDDTINVCGSSNFKNSDETICMAFDEYNEFHRFVDPSGPITEVIYNHTHQVYENLFGRLLESKNKKAQKMGHPERVRTIEDLLKNPRTCPEEILIVFKSSENPDIDEDSLVMFTTDFIDEQIQKYGDNIQFLFAEIHLGDVSYVRILRTWIYFGNKGLDISRHEALKEMEIPLPNPDKRPSRFNNRAIYFSYIEEEMLWRHFKECGLDYSYMRFNLMCEREAMASCVPER